MINFYCYQAKFSWSSSVFNTVFKKARQSVLQDSECSFPCQGCNLRISLWNLWLLSLLSNSWSISLTKNNSSPGISCRSTGGLPWVTQRTEIENHPTSDYLKDSADLSFSLLFLSYLPRGNHSRGAPLLITVLLLLIQNVLQRLLLQKASLIVSAGPSLLAPSQPTWTNLEEQFLSACPFSHSRM